MATYRDIPLTKILILKFNTVIPGNQLAQITEIAARLGLRIERVTQEANLKIVQVSGSQSMLETMDQELVRHASISRKVVSVLNRSELP